MTTLLLLLALVVAGVAAQLLVAGAREVPRTAATGAGRDSGRRLAGLAGEVSVVVPARDEAATLPLLLASLQAQQAPPREVVVVDDGSHDDTADLARAAGATVLAIDGPAPGWTGKSHACHVGATAATGRALLFLDADVVLQPDALEGLVALHSQHGGLVSVQPHHRPQRAYEQLSAYFNVVGLLASGAFTRARPDPPMAFGPVLLMAADDHARVGGHGSVRSEILDDASLARAFGRAGLPVNCFLGGDSIQFRMYPDGLRQLVEGWSKNIASGAGAANRWCSTLAALWLASHWVVAVGSGLALAGALGASLHGPVSPLGAPALYAAAWPAAALHLRLLLRRAGAFQWWTWALFPLPLLAFTLIFVRSVVLTTVRREVTWRGRSIPTSPPPGSAQP